MSESTDLMESADSASSKEVSASESPMDQDSPTSGPPTPESGPTDTQASLLQMASGSKKGPKIRAGVWLAAGISRQYLINGIPIAGVINEHGVPRPSLRGPDIWPTEETIEEVTRMAEENDWSAIKETRSVFHLAGPQKGQLRDAYIWIALRTDAGGTFALSKFARYRLVPRWRELVEASPNGLLPPTFDLRQGRSAVASSSEPQMGRQDLLQHLDEQSSAIIGLSQKVECQAAAIKQLTDSIAAEAVINQQVVAGLQQVEHAMQGSFGGCRQQ